MAANSKDGKRFFWLKLKEDFFDDDAISWLEEQNNGKEYALFYLKLCLKSLKNNGLLIRHVGDMIIPYNVKNLSELTRTDEDTVMVALKLLERIGLVETLDNGTLFLSQLGAMVGSSADNDNAERQRRHRAKLKQQKYLERTQSVTKSNAKSNSVTLRLSNESIEYRDKNDTTTTTRAREGEDSDGDPELSRVVKLYADNINPSYGPIESEKLVALYDKYHGRWLEAAIVEAAESSRRPSVKYIATILERWERDGFQAPKKRKGGESHARRTAVNLSPAQLAEQERFRRDAAEAEARPKPWDVPEAK